MNILIILLLFVIWQTCQKRAEPFKVTHWNSNVVTNKQDHLINQSLARDHYRYTRQGIASQPAVNTDNVGQAVQPSYVLWPQWQHGFTYWSTGNMRQKGVSSTEPGYYKFIPHQDYFIYTHPLDFSTPPVLSKFYHIPSRPMSGLDRTSSILKPSGHNRWPCVRRPNKYYKN